MLCLKLKSRRVVIHKGVNELARRCGVSPTTISLVIRGRRKPGKELADRLKRLGAELEKEAGNA